MNNRQHIPYMEHKPLTGTPRYCSINTHLGIEQSRRDDLESMGYILIYFMRGSLPWQGIRAANKIQRYERIQEKKLQVSVAELCRGLPPPMQEFMYYVKNLRFEDEPDYEHLIGLFDDFMQQQGYNDTFDWVEQGVDLDSHFVRSEEEKVSAFAVIGKDGALDLGSI